MERTAGRGMDSWPSPSSPLERKGDEEGLEEAEEGEEEAEDEEDTERAERSYCGGEWVVLRLKEKKRNSKMMKTGLPSCGSRKINELTF